MKPAKQEASPRPAVRQPPRITRIQLNRTANWIGGKSEILLESPSAGWPPAFDAEIVTAPLPGILVRSYVHEHQPDGTVTRKLRAMRLLSWGGDATSVEFEP